MKIVFCFVIYDTKMQKKEKNMSEPIAKEIDLKDLKKLRIGPA